MLSELNEKLQVVHKIEENDIIHPEWKERMFLFVALDRVDDKVEMEVEIPECCITTGK